VKPKLGDPVGLAAGKMNEKQHDLLMKLLKSYTDRMRADIAEMEWKRLKERKE